MNETADELLALKLPLSLHFVAQVLNAAQHAAERDGYTALYVDGCHDGIMLTGVYAGERR